MQDYIKRLLIAGLMALCVSLLFLGGKHAKAEMSDLPQLTSEWIWPAEGVVTDLYGSRNGNHKGIDIAAELGEGIFSVDKGIVTKSYYSTSYGHVIFIRHENNLETVYAHLNERLVAEGESVERGDKIGGMGNTGDSSGVHLHFEIHEQKWTVNKENALDPSLVLGESVIGQPIVTLERPRRGDSLETLGRLPQDDDAFQAIKTKHDAAVTAARTLPEQYVVVSGDTLYSIAKKMNTTVDWLKKKNHLHSDLILPHQTLVTR